jgi:hypothetical protein
MSLLLQFAGASSTTYTYTVAGGFLLAGSAEISKSVVPSVSGGLTLAGSGASSRSITYTASGGILFDGTSAITITHVPPASGGKVFGGSAATEFVSAGSTVFSYSPSGGLTFTGNAEASFVSATPAASGGMWKWAGRKRNPKPKQFGITGSGGLSLGGSAHVSRTRSVVARINQPRGRATSRVAFSRVHKTASPRVALSGRSRCRLVSVPVFVPAKPRVDTAAIVAAARHARRTREEAEVAMIMSQF